MKSSFFARLFFCFFFSEHLPAPVAVPEPMGANVKAVLAVPAPVPVPVPIGIVNSEPVGAPVGAVVVVLCF